MTRGEQARLTAWRLKVLQHAAAQQNVARVCRRFGISRKSFYKWKRRRAEHGDDFGKTDRREPERDSYARPFGCVITPPILKGEPVSQFNARYEGSIEHHKPKPRRSKCSRM
jgi:Helix-turn-helix domain